MVIYTRALRFAKSFGPSLFGVVEHDAIDSHVLDVDLQDGGKRKVPIGRTDNDLVIAAANCFARSNIESPQSAFSMSATRCSTIFQSKGARLRSKRRTSSTAGCLQDRRGKERACAIRRERRH